MNRVALVGLLGAMVLVSDMVCRLGGVMTAETAEAAAVWNVLCAEVGR